MSLSPLFTFLLYIVVSLATSVAHCQDYPNKPIRIVSSAAGGSVDFAARLIAQGLTRSLGKQVIVDNRAGGIIAGEIVAQAQHDGYTLLAASGSFWLAPLLQKVPFDPLKDFSTITLLAKAPNVLVVHPSLAVKTVKELIAHAKTRPGELNYAAGNSGSSPHLAGELFKAMAGVGMVPIMYKGNAAALNDLLGGQVQLMFSTPAPVMAHIKFGRLRALAVTSAQSSTLFPDLPTIAASGLPGYEVIQLTGMFTPAKTPTAIVNKLNREIGQTLNQADVKSRFLSSGSEAVPSSPGEFAAAIKAEMASMGKMIKNVGITAE